MFCLIFFFITVTQYLCICEYILSGFFGSVKTVCLCFEEKIIYFRQFSSMLINKQLKIRIRLFAFTSIRINFIDFEVVTNLRREDISVLLTIRIGLILAIAGRQALVCQCGQQVFSPLQLLLLSVTPFQCLLFPLGKPAILICFPL